MLANQIGYYSLILGLLLSVLLCGVSIKDFNKTNKQINQNILSLSFLQLVFVIVSFLSLIVSFINSDFSNETVFNNSHTTKPLFYKISGTWGNHEGSLLLWLLVLTLFIFLFLIKSREQPKKYRILTLLFQQIIIIGFFLFVLITSNPFNYLFPIPNEGLGLNPILQDPALAIHPPILYLGYVGTSIIFSSSLAAVTQNYVTKEWGQHIKKWVLVSWIFLTIGIMLGSIWAYYELGWGGFWFWDPVENVSLMPWLTLTALLHCIVVLERRASLTSWAVVLSITTFTLSMCGTFLVRSGILNSVHTFANDPARGIFILIFLFALIVLSLGIFFIFHKENNKSSNNFFWLSRETSILINNWFMMYFLAVVLIGTVYPIFLDVISSEKISVGPPFYQKLIVPFLIPFLLFMSLGPRLKWIKSKIENKNSLIITFIISVMLTFFIIKNLTADLLFYTVLISAAFFLFFTTLKELFIKKFNNISQTVSHFGFSLLILSILFNSILSSEIITNIKIGERYDYNKGEIFFKKIEERNESNFNSIIASFEIKDKNGKTIELKPEIRIYNQPIIITSEADIRTTLLEDKFLVMNLVKGNEYFNIRYQVKPFMVWIWISVLLLSLGGLMSLFKREI
ncbi:heme lyase CcmF/NrfE family subunit [Candidatus Pelagibacter ubique]|nr:heme lyase CcmF/NrfE family subunit [Candidatus Pelagibacter ubique]MDA7489082.1 heme lyase CcmF/NrfE family subunit [Candidatus Pelagibacter ubique]MDB3876456.1 heme lyase CcmF/NrfE family subunit [Candidatus Pelagibacter ubique]MDB9796884.1 heme lyase CcmF/NrfE family subunit [Candidatus Pelagibacter ubique]MDC0391383.1 heme lyase CcmF/NrfE family subunit [Candidatus Pelagibacter ubique]